MNFQDIVNKNKEQLKILYELEGFINSVNAAKEFSEETHRWLFSTCFNNKLTDMCALTRNRYIELRELLINIDGYELKDAITRIRNIYFNPQIEEALETIEKSYLALVAIRKINDADKKVEFYKDCNINLNMIINRYNKLKSLIEYSDNVNKDLYKESDKIQLKIRLLNENNNIEDLIENVTIINSIYTNINNLIGDESSKLKFSRIESGSLEVCITGFIATIITIKPILEFAYKVYAEQFSPNAKLDVELKKAEIQEKNIKIRGEIYKFIKKVDEDAEIKKLSNIGQQEILTALGNLDNHISKFFSRNPFIIIDNKEFGLKEMKDKGIPINYLTTSDLEIKSISELEKNTDDKESTD